MDSKPDRVSLASTLAVSESEEFGGASEDRLGTVWAFQRADTDGDGVLSEGEYLYGWLPIVVLRAGEPTANQG